MRNRIVIFVGVVALVSLASGGTALGFVSPGSSIQLVSVNSRGAQGNNDSQAAAITPDRRYVAFASSADNLVPGDTNAAFDVFVRDRLRDTTERVSVGPLGVEGDGNSGLSTFRAVDISADGRYVAFVSTASNFAPLVDTNRNEDVFVHDRRAGTTELISVGLDGTAQSGSAPSISADGRLVSFTSFGDQVVTGDENSADDIFVRDRVAGTTERVSVTSAGAEVGQGSFASALSASGRFVAFNSFSGLLVPGDRNDSVDVFVHDRQTGATEGISTRTACDPTIGDICGNSLLGSISSNGRFVGFESTMQNLVRGDNDFVSDAFVADRQTGRLRLVSQSNDGVKGNDDSHAPLVSADGRYVVFSSRADNLVRRDANQQEDVFRRDVLQNETERIAGDDTQFPFAVLAGDVTPDGFTVALETRAALRPERDVGFFATDVYVLELRRVGGDNQQMG
jgi:Tol biopolymer transport system component